MPKESETSLGSADIHRIKRMIPHRYPFLLIDKVMDMDAGKSALGIKNVTSNEPHFEGHFPDQPVMPGVLIVEAMAQTAAVLVVHTLDVIDHDMLVYFMTIENAKFRRTVVPGDVLELHVSVVRNRGKVWKFRGEGIVGGTVCAEADFTAMIMEPGDVEARS